MLLCTTNQRVGTNEKALCYYDLTCLLEAAWGFLGDSGDNRNRLIKEGNFLYSVIVLISCDRQAPAEVASTEVA
jgi:hypothetical protein